ncbi:MAG: restriction endonuclease subunit S [Nitrososphaerota archaeon]|jgi:type I restriction enzyme S subunit|nr:restriction endonuclease subunit S [Nitrososphaerota archaeon]
MDKWKIARLGDVLEYEQPTKYIVQNTEYKDAYSIPVLTAGQSFILGYTNETDNIFSDNLPVIIFDDFTTAIKYVDFPFKVKSSAMKILKARKNVEIKYLYYYMTRIKVDTELHKRYWISMYSHIQIPLPPLHVQQKIVNALDRVIALIEKRKVQIRKCDLLVKSQFIEMFGDPVTNPMGWKTASFSEITNKIGSGATPKGGQESYIDEGISLIRSMNVHNGYFKYDELAHITDKQAKQLDNVTVQKNDVLLNITGASVARSCVVPSEILPARVNQHVAIIRCNSPRFNHIFANALLISDSYQRFMLSLGESGGATRQAITKQQIENFTTILPPIEIQTRFAEFVYHTDKSKFVAHQLAANMSNVCRLLFHYNSIIVY